MPTYPNHANFNPHYAPLQVLMQGAFGGTAYNKVSKFNRLSNASIDDIRSLEYKLWNLQEYDPAVNLYPGTEAYVRRKNKDMPDSVRMMNPDGWFHWYMLFDSGRAQSGSIDYRIQQWREEVRNLMFYVKKECAAVNKPITDLTVEAAKIWRQHLLHFGYDSTIDPNTYLK